MKLRLHQKPLINDKIVFVNQISIQNLFRPQIEFRTRAAQYSFVMELRANSVHVRAIPGWSTLLHTTYVIQANNIYKGSGRLAVQPKQE